MPAAIPSRIDVFVERTQGLFRNGRSRSVVVEESIVEGSRLVIVATSGDGFTAEVMLADWHGLAYTIAWDDLGWLDESSDAGR